MKRNILLYTVLLAMVFSGCQKLDLQPKGQLGQPELFGNEYGVKKYFVGIYNYLPIEDFTYYGTNGNGFRQDGYWESGKFSQGNMSGEFFNTWAGVNNGGFGYWPYDRVRDVNVFLRDFPIYQANYTTTAYNALLGEARFLRAFFYFGMAKRYGGVPIVTTVFNPAAPKDSLEVPRNTEYDTWKFIYSDLQFAIANMPDKSEFGRANKFVAAALMSRAMLYAGSIAKYTTYLNYGAERAYTAGLAGIDPGKANEFFQYAVDAGKLIETGPYALYNKGGDLALNFANVFLDASSTENIFVKDFDPTAPRNPHLYHSYDAMMSPQPDMTTEVGAESYPPFDFMELYEMPAYINPDGTPVRFNNRSDLKTGIEPRMKGTLYFDGDVLRGKTFSIQKGIYRTYTGTAADAQGGNNGAPINSGGNRILGGRNETVDINGVKLSITGTHGHFTFGADGENNAWGAAYVRKYINPTMTVPEAKLWNSGTPWIVFRLGEIYLNTAEALYELGKRDEAFDNYIFKLRDRAGCQVKRPATDQTTSNIGSINKAIYPYQIEKSLQFIRDERARELYGENHWWWDIRRWRTADQILNNFRPRMLSAYFVANEGKYIFIDEINRNNRSWNASKSCFYEPIPGGEILKNAKLLPNNPLY